MKKTNRLFAAIAAMMMALALASCNEKGGTAAIEKLKKAAPAPEADFEFKLTEDGNGVIIRRYKGKAKTLVIPATVQGLPVVRVGIGGFRDHNGSIFYKEGDEFKSITVREVVLSEGITVIESYAFAFPSERDSPVTTVVLPSTLKLIGCDAFRNLKNLTTVNLPEGLEYIGDSAFYNTALTSVTLPKNVFLSEGAFSGCNSLTEINIPEDNSIKTSSFGLGAVFGGTKISEDIALQKKLKEAKVLVDYPEYYTEKEKYDAMTGHKW